MTEIKIQDKWEPSEPDPLDFDHVHQQERENIRQLHPVDTAKAMPQTGLAFSGGGIRSATFNLGILQALAELKLLREFDYLSCVSGGGYIGGWLSAFIKRKCEGKIEKAEELLCTGGDENASIRFLRSYSNYLTPKPGFFSADTLTALATYLRNLYLNQTLLLLVLGSLLLLPRVFMWLVQLVTGRHGIDAVSTIAQLTPIFLTSAILLAMAMIFVGMNLAVREIPDKEGGFFATKQYTRQGWIVTLIVMPMVLSAWLLTFGMIASAEEISKISLGHWLLWGQTYAALWFLGWLVGYFANRNDSKQQHYKILDLLPMIVFTLAAAALGGLLMAGFAEIIMMIHEDFSYSAPWIASALATALLLKFISLTVVAHVGLMGRKFSHESREWWSRLGGWVFLLSICWAVFFTLVFIIPPFFHWASTYFISSGGLVWIAITAWGIRRGSGPETNGKNKTRWHDTFTLLAPYVFIAGLLGLLSFGLHELILKFNCIYYSECFDHDFTQGRLFRDILEHEAGNIQSSNISVTFALLAGSIAFALLLASRLDVNLFSIYHFYRQRLARCYLGASRCKLRTPHPFTGFDPEDDLRLAAFQLNENGRMVYQRPYPIHNTAMNLVAGKQLAWQQRRAAAFAFTPQYCGYSFKLPDEKGALLSFYRPTSQYMENVWLGSAVAISGAAASPNMGYHSSPALTFLMTVFNVRLGHWSGNPNDKHSWKRQGPRFGGQFLLKELFGLTNYRSSYIYLSDGGHFENLGIYELIRRRCTTIVVIDAGQDAESKFNDLGNAVRKVYADFGVVIDIHMDEQSRKYCTLGRIFYPQTSKEPAKEGTLIHIKPSLLGSEPVDLKNYAVTHPGFPHQSTSDQWFDESQFESYRKLGYWIGKSVFETPLMDAEQRMKGEVRLSDVSAIMRDHADFPPDH